MRTPSGERGDSVTVVYVVSEQLDDICRARDVVELSSHSLGGHKHSLVSGNSKVA
jgi:hypothetical protein